MTLVRNGAPRKSCSLAFSHSLGLSEPTFTNSQDTVKCDRCQNFFHMGCVQPPLSAKPSRGYGWTCAPCSKRHEEEVDSHEVIRHSTPSGNKPKAPSRARGPGRPRKDRKLAEQEENAPIKHFGMWPFRYFGWVQSSVVFILTTVLMCDLSVPFTEPTLFRKTPSVCTFSDSN